MRATTAVLVAFLAATMGCSAPAPRPTHVPAFPTELATPHADAWAAFELRLRSDGSVAHDAMRIVGWDASGASATVLVALRNVASETKWEAIDDAGEAKRYAVLVLDGNAQPLLDGTPARTTRLVEQALRARRSALAALTSTLNADERTLEDEHELGDEHALDCVWMTLHTLRSGAPFLHDEVRGWSGLEPELRDVEQRDGGLWVCRVARSTHQGQFVFLDTERQVIGVGAYILGE